MSKRKKRKPREPMVTQRAAQVALDEAVARRHKWATEEMQRQIEREKVRQFALVLRSMLVAADKAVAMNAPKVIGHQFFISDEQARALDKTLGEYGFK